MTKEEFVEAYMTNSNLFPYTLDGEVVKFTSGGDTEYVLYALECKCEEDGCLGWAMVRNGHQNFHRYQNGLTNLTLEEALEADLKCLDKENGS